MADTPTRRRDICVFADVSMNLIDGSSIWLQSVTLALAAMPDVQVHLLLRESVTRDLLLDPLRGHDNINIIEPESDADEAGEGGSAPVRLDPEKFISMVEALNERHPFVGVLVRGNSYSEALADHESLSKILWAYLLDRPPLVADIDDAPYVNICKRARFLIAQSEPQRALLEARIPEANGKIVVLPPMLPAGAEVPAKGRTLNEAGDFELVYAGKYSRLWNVESYFDLPAAMSAKSRKASVVLIGDKIHKEKRDAGFHDRILDKLQHTEGVTWLKGLSREDTYKRAGEADFGLCWRSDNMNESIEVSTKFLEFGSLGLPVFLNRTQNYELALGKDYPFFASTAQDIFDALERVQREPELYSLASQRCVDFARGFTLETATARLRRLLELSPPAYAGKKTTIAIASHDFKFITSVRAHLEQDPSIHVIIDTWQGHRSHRLAHSKNVLAKADVIFCEWCCGNAIWYSQNKRPNQRLVIRLHRFEYFTDYPKEVNIDKVDAVIVVSEHFKKVLMLELGWPASKIVVEPQYVDAHYLDRGKHPHADKTLGFVGIVSFSHKRLDRAVDVLERVLERHPDYKLRVRSRMPWEFPWAWVGDPVARQAYQKLFARIRKEKKLRDAVIFDNAGADMGEWYRNVGYILSTSESEGCHTSVAEGMASGAIPVLIDWEGARTVYPDEFVHDSVEKMAAAIIDYADDEQKRRKTRDEMRVAGAGGFDIVRTINLYRSYIDGAEGGHHG